MRVTPDGGRPLTLTPADFVARGGQGAVYARAGVAYKLFDDLSQVPPPAKIAALRGIQHDAVLAPRAVLRSPDGAAAGYSMAFIAHASPWCRLFSPAYQARIGLDEGRRTTLVEQLRAALDAVHQAGVLAVDLNPMNVLVGPDHDQPWLIDTDSYQTPGHPATALMETVRDRHAPPGVFDEGTDWFAFAVITFPLFAGIHPYRGKHPTVHGLDARMQADLSVFDPRVVRPPMCPPLTGIPDRLRGWFRAVFDARFRGPPPADFGQPGRVQQAVLGGAGARVERTPTRTFDAPVRAWAQQHGVSVVVADAVYVDGHRVHSAPPPEAGAITIGFARNGRPVVAALGPGGLTLSDPVAGHTLAFGLRLDALCAAGGRLYGQSGAHLVELAVQPIGDRLVATPRTVARVLPHATRLYPGVVIQSLAGATHLAALGGPACAMVHAPALDGLRIIDAVGAGGVVVVHALDGDRRCRLTLRFGADGRSDVRRDTLPEHADFADLELVALDTGVCISRAPDGGLELFARRPGDARRKAVDDPGLATLRLVSRQGALGYVEGAEVGTLRLRSSPGRG